VTSRLFTFVGGGDGPWRVVNATTIVGEPLLRVERLIVVAGAGALTVPGPGWILRGIRSNERYVTRSEKEQLAARQPALGRPEATCRALIPIRKSAAWWAMTQDERRGILEERSRHIQTGLNYRPAVARRLHHCRDLGEEGPFDFLTWFEFAPSDAAAFEELVAVLRASEEWRFVEREVDLRLVRESADPAIALAEHRPGPS